MERPSPTISSAVHRARPNGDEYAWSKEMPRASNAARVASACSRPRTVSGESCQPCKMFCTLSSVCPCRAKYRSATCPPLVPPQRGRAPLWWFTAGSRRGDAQLHQYVGEWTLGYVVYLCLVTPVINRAVGVGINCIDHLCLGGNAKDHDQLDLVLVAVKSHDINRTRRKSLEHARRHLGRSAGSCLYMPYPSFYIQKLNE